MGALVRNGAMAACMLVGAGCGEDVEQIVTPRRECNIQTQNDFLYDLLQRTYLWNAELPEIEPIRFNSPGELLNEVRFEGDHWSYVTDLELSQEFFNEGKRVAVGAVFNRSDVEHVEIVQVLPDTPAEEAGLRRGDLLRSINGMTPHQIDLHSSWKLAFGPNRAGVRVDLEVESRNGEIREVPLYKDVVEIASVPVYNVTMLGDRAVGYLMFQTFVDPAVEELNDVFAEFQAAGVKDLIVDMRYNGGGLLGVAQHLTSLMMADEVGERMYSVEYNERKSDDSWSRSFVERDASIQVERAVFVMTNRTKSSSELVLNSLRPYVEVLTVGTPSGGKPFGMHHVAYCDRMMAPITFRMVNADGEGHYEGGIEPDCRAPDDVSQELGDPREGSLQAARQLLLDGTCPEPPPDGISTAPRDPGALSGLDRVFDLR